MDDKKSNIKAKVREAIGQLPQPGPALQIDGDGNIQCSQTAVGGQCITGNNNIQLSGEFSAEQLAALLKDRRL